MLPLSFVSFFHIPSLSLSFSLSLLPTLSPEPIYLSKMALVGLENKL